MHINHTSSKEVPMTFNELETHIKEVGERIIDLRGYL